MNRDWNSPWDEEAQEPSGGGPLERSESGPPPESPAGEGAPGDVDDDSTAKSELEEAGGEEEWAPDPLPPRLAPKRRRRTMAKPPQKPRMPLSPQQKILLLDLWKRSGLPARDFGALVDVSHHTLYVWKRKFELEGPAGLMPKPKGVQGSRISEITKRAILMMKEANPEWGCQRISDMLFRGPALAASPGAVSKVLREAGYEAQEIPTKPHPDKVRRFERAKVNQLWQTDLFTFMLKRQNRRVHLVAFMDDHSRFITSYGLHASQSAALVIEVLRSGLASYGPPEEILTDNGSQYVTWRGKSQFTKELEKRGVKQIVARPRRPQTLGKIERFWGTLWRECIESAVFLDLEDARRRIGLFIDYYNFQRPHRGIEGLVPADRFFNAAPEVLKTLKERVARNALELARTGVPKSPLYLTGVADGKPFSVHREGDRVVLHKAGEPREEVELPAADSDTPKDAPDETPSLPETVCKDGSPHTAWSPPSGVVDLLPGQSGLDDALSMLNPSESHPASDSDAGDSDDEAAPSGDHSKHAEQGGDDER